MNWTKELELIDGILQASPCSLPDRAVMHCRVKKWYPPSRYRKDNYGNEHIRVIEEAGISRTDCMQCGCRSDGYNFHVHHINRKRHDNRLENLIVVCPTCHWSKHHNGEPVPEPYEYDQGYDMHIHGIATETLGAKPDW